MDIALENALVFLGGKVQPKSVLLQDGKIAAIEGSVDAVNRIDCRGLVLLPGLVDAHVHFRIPGAAQKEDWSTGSRAAAAGGVTTVFDMPNNNPSCTTQRELDLKRKVAESDSVCNFAFHFGASNDNMQQLETVKGTGSFKVFMGSSTGTLLITDEKILRRVFSIAKKRNFVVLVHAEDEGTIRKNSEAAKKKGWNHARYHSKIRTCEVEAKAIERALKLQAEVGNRLHICHVSSAQGLELIREAKQGSAGISCEVTPHHLFLSQEATEELGNFAKMNPSLKTSSDVKALWKGISNGTVDIIATDHAPHTKEEKEKQYWEAPSGVPGIETMLPLLLDAVNRERIELQKIVELCCSSPAKIFGLPCSGEIKIGNSADLALVDLESEQTIKNGRLFTKCNWSPFATWKLRGCVERTFVLGGEVFSNESEGRAVQPAV